MKARQIIWVSVCLGLLGWIIFMMFYTWNMTGAEKLSDPVCWLSAVFGGLAYLIIRTGR